MNKELEKICQEKVMEFDKEFGDHWAYQDHNSESFEMGFQAAIESEQVQGLVEALEQIRAYSLGSKADICDEALEKFRGDAND